MTDRVLFDLLDGNREHVDSLPKGYFDDVQDAQRPAAVSVCCSDSRVAQERMWSVDQPGWLFTPSNIGNQAWDENDGKRVVDGNLLYPLVNTGTRVAVIVGHTGCGAVTAAYRSVTGDSFNGPPGIARRIEWLEPVVEEALEDGTVDRAAPDMVAVNHLVEYNVDRQVAFLRSANVVPDGVSVHGFVYDFQEVYGDAPGRTYLVNRDGETDPDTIRKDLPESYDPQVKRLLYAE